MYRYEGNESEGCPDSTFGQSVAQKLCIPMIPGAAPPSYPGERPQPPLHTVDSSHEDGEPLNVLAKAYREELKL